MGIRRGNEVNFMRKGCFLENLGANFRYALKDDSGVIGANNRCAEVESKNRHMRVRGYM